MHDPSARTRVGSGAIPAADLVLPVLDLAAHDRAPTARPARLPAPDVVGAGDMLSRTRPRPAPRTPPEPPPPPAPPVPAPRSAPWSAPWSTPWSAAFGRLRPAANDNRIRIAVLTAILALLVAHVVLDRVEFRAERAIEVAPPTQPGRMITAL